MRRLALVILVCISAAGCINTRKPATQPVTAIDPAQATPGYWLGQPAVITVQGKDFNSLWDSTERVARDYYFVIDRADQRLALMTTEPLVSKQIFEFWRKDVPRLHDQVEASLATVRRTARFEVSRTPQGTYVLTPKVLVERFSAEEHRVTAALNVNEIYSKPISEVERASEGKNWPSQYWYAIGRDKALESKLGEAIRKRMRE
jgi:hypothetical protein